MDIMSYNIFEGASGRLDKIARVVKTYSPKILALQETNTFLDKPEQAKEFSQNTGLTHFEVAEAGAYDYHVGTFSKIPLKNIQKLKPFRNACLVTVINSEVGEIAVFNVHLSPNSEDERLREIDQIIATSRKFQNSILIGDFNSLSIHDNYESADGSLRFEVVGSILAAGFYDCGEETKIPTVPTPFSQDAAHKKPLRLDYAFVSAGLKNRVKSFQVIKTNETNTASDHYPILLTLV